MDDNSIVFVSESPGATIGFGEKIGGCLEGGVTKGSNPIN